MKQQEKVELLFDKLNQLLPVINAIKEDSSTKDESGLFLVLEEIEDLIRQTDAVMEADLSIITNVAAQSNLIALNLSIEVERMAAPSNAITILFDHIKLISEYARKIADGKEIESISIPKLAVTKKSDGVVKKKSEKSLWKQLFGR
jgi:hypothetical protein